MKKQLWKEIIISMALLAFCGVAGTANAGEIDCLDGCVLPDPGVAEAEAEADDAVAAFCSVAKIASADESDCIDGCVLPDPGVADEGSLADWVISFDSGESAGPLSPALLGHYDLSGSLFNYNEAAGLSDAMEGAGFAEWRIGAGRWEIGTRLLPTLTDDWLCDDDLIDYPWQAFAPDGSTDLDLIESRDWFSDDGEPVTVAMTQDDGRYRLDYLQSAIDVAKDFGASPYVSIDHMPRALSVNRTPERSFATIEDPCVATFTNSVSNVRPADPAVFAAAVTGLVRRIVEESGDEPPPLYWEFWNEPEMAYFWDPRYEKGGLDRFFDVAVKTLFSLDAYRDGSEVPAATDLKFGLGSFLSADTAGGVISIFDANPVKGGYVPMDFVSFHAYNNDPLKIVEEIETVAAARDSSNQYRNVELVLAEWGPDLSGAGWSDTNMDMPLHAATVIAMGAALGLDRAHRAIFWDYYKDGVIKLGLIDNNGLRKPLYYAYSLLSTVIGNGNERIDPIGIEGGKLDDGRVAVLASRDEEGVVRLLLVNRGKGNRIFQVELDGLIAAPARVLVFDNPAEPPHDVPVKALVRLPARSIVLVEFPTGAEEEGSDSAQTYGTIEDDCVDGCVLPDE